VERCVKKKQRIKGKFNKEQLRLLREWLEITLEYMEKIDQAGKSID